MLARDKGRKVNATVFLAEVANAGLSELGETGSIFR